MMKWKYAVLLLVISVYACSKLVEDDELILLERVENVSDALRLDGYYFNTV